MQGLIFGNPVIQGKIFSYLTSDPTAVKTASLVCRSWNSLLDKPKYWAWAGAELRRETFWPMFSSRRFRNIGSVIIFFCLTQEQLKALFHGLGDCSLKKLKCLRNLVWDVSPEVVAAALVRLEEVDLRCFISAEVVQSLMKAIGETQQLKLQKLRLGPFLYGDRVEPELFQHLLRIKDLKVEDMYPTQVVALYKFIEETKDLKLKNFTFGVN